MLCGCLDILHTPSVLVRENFTHKNIRKLLQISLTGLWWMAACHFHFCHVASFLPDFIHPGTLLPDSLLYCIVGCWWKWHPMWVMYHNSAYYCITPHFLLCKALWEIIPFFGLKQKFVSKEQFRLFCKETTWYCVWATLAIGVLLNGFKCFWNHGLFSRLWLHQPPGQGKLHKAGDVIKNRL